MMIYNGTCLCGEVAFKVEGSFENFYLCHCSRCRKGSGSAHSANLFSSTAKLSWLVGKEKVKTFNLNGEGHSRSFCDICGSALPNIQADGQLLLVPAGSLDTKVNIKPQGHIYMDSKANWDKNLCNIPTYKILPKIIDEN